MGYDYVEFYHQSAPSDPMGTSTNGFTVGSGGLGYYSTDFNNFASTFNIADSVKLSSFDFIGIYRHTDEDPFGSPKELITGFESNNGGNPKITFPFLSADPTETWALVIDEDGVLSSQPISGGGSGLTYAQVKALKFK